MVDRRQLRRIRRVAKRLDNDLRDQTVERLGWLAKTADRAREIDRTSAPGKVWFKNHGVPRTAARTFVRFARERQALGDERSLALSKLFSKIAGVCFRLRQPCRRSD